MPITEITLCFFALAISFAEGFLLLRLLTAFVPRLNLLTEIALSFPLGAGLSSIFYFLVLSFLGNKSIYFFATEAVLVLSLLYFCLKQRAGKKATKQDDSVPWDSLTKYLIAIVTALSTLDLIIITQLMRLSPTGAWDAVMMYNLRARFLYLAGEHWQDAFSSMMPWTYPDHPAFLSTFIARTWHFVGRESSLIPQLVSILFIASLCLLLFSCVLVLRSRAQALLSVSFLLSTPFFVLQGGSMQCDIPFAAYVLSAFLLLIIYDSDKESKSASVINFPVLFLAGFALGLSAWTKNEGILFLLCLFSMRLLFKIPSLLPKAKASEPRAPLLVLKENLWLSAGSFLPLLCLCLLKLKFHIPSDIFQGLSPEIIINRLSDLPRILCIAEYFAKYGIQFGSWFSCPLPLLTFYLLFFQDRKSTHSWALQFACTIAVVIFGYMLIDAISMFLASVEDTRIFMECNLSRLFIQYWPAVIFLVFATGADLHLLFSWTLKPKEIVEAES